MALLLDKNIRVRFIAMESISYLTSFMKKEKIIKIASEELITS